MVTKEILNATLEKIYELDEYSTKDFGKKLCSIYNYKGHENHWLLTGSLKEGAWVIPFLIPIEGKNCDVDLMMTIKVNRLSKMVPSSLEETAYPGYYVIKLGDGQMSRNLFSVLRGQYTLGDILRQRTPIRGLEFETGCPAGTGPVLNLRLGALQELDLSLHF